MPAGKQDSYAVLGLPNDASDDAIRAAYKKLALQWHPDRHLVGKEHAAQMFIEVNQAYHALMDGKESTHSSSTETSSSTCAPTTGSSADHAHSDTHTKDTQASSRPPSASSNSSKRSSPQTSKTSSAPCKDHATNGSKSTTQSRASPSTSSSSSSSSHDSSSGDPKSRSRPAKPSTDRSHSSSDRTKNGSKSSRPHKYPRGSPGSAAPKAATPASTHGCGSEGLSSKSSNTGSSPSEPETKQNSRPEKTSRTGTGRSRTSKPVIPPRSQRLHKSAKFGFANEFVHMTSKGANKEGESPLPHDEDPTSYGSPLRAINAPRGASKEWIFPLPLTLEEMYHGTSYRLLVTRELLSHKREQVEISIDIPPGMRNGTRIVCPRSGHQRKDGTLQDVVFLIEDVPEERFSRVKDDLFLDVCIPWADPLADQGGEICIQGIDGKEITFTLPYPIYDKATEGQILVKGAGMPIRDGRKTIGRGDMIVRWRVVFAPHQSKWQTLKKALHLDV